MLNYFNQRYAERYANKNAEKLKRKEFKWVLHQIKTEAAYGKHCVFLRRYSYMDFDLVATKLKERGFGVWDMDIDSSDGETEVTW